MAFGLPVEGDEGPFAGDAAVPAASTCSPDEPAADVAHRLADLGADRVLVLGTADVVLGMAGLQALEAAGEETVGEVMEVVPTTIRPSVVASSLADAEEPVVVTTGAGTLVGVVEPTEEGVHDAHDDDGVAAAVVETAQAVEEHFGDRQPSEEEVGEFLRERLMAEGRSPEEADRILQGADDTGSE
ncbi:MAG TPA: hypothetical protein VGV63_05710 [Acidimicrobiales bacterium]|nr:hypothetical protein [Acidimicrobiales bacterium]